MNPPSSIGFWRFLQGTSQNHRVFLKKLTALLLAFLFFFSPLARVSAQTAPADSPPQTPTSDGASSTTTDQQSVGGPADPAAPPSAAGAPTPDTSTPAPSDETAAPASSPSV